MSIDDETIYRDRARQYVTEGLSDPEIDRKVMYLDHADRERVLRHVAEFRATVSPKQPRADTPATELSANRIREMIAEDIAKGGSGSKVRVSRRFNYNVSSLKRVWRRVGGGAEWPSKKAP